LTAAFPRVILLTVVVAPNRDRQAERREATRQEILTAAWDVAREQGLAQLTLREVAARVGMRAPSLYSHFPSKHAIYDAMYRQAWETYEAEIDGLEERLPREPRAALKTIAASFVDFALADLPRHQLMNVRTIPGFAPSPESYEPAVRIIQRLHASLARLGVTDPAGADLFTALTGGLVDQQWANDPGGDRWRRLLGRVIDMYATEMGLPRPRRSTR
jgi:AcrR family transcriptional regulator